MFRTSGRQAEIDDSVQWRINRRGFLRSAAAVGLLAGPAGTMLEACSSSAGGEHGTHGGKPKKGGTLKIGVGAAPASLDPFRASAGPDRVSYQPAVNYLVTVDPSFKVIPQLAEEWTPSKDARTWTLKLRKNVRFHDGKVFDADDVVASFDRLVDKVSGSTMASTFAGMLAKGSTRKVDATTVRFELERPVAEFVNYLAEPPNAILPSTFTSDWAHNPNGTGPFKLKHYQAQQSAEYVRFDDYWDEGLPYLDGVNMVFGSSSTTPTAFINGIKSGSIDVVPHVELDLLPTIKNDANLQLIFAPSSRHVDLYLPVDQKPFTDIRVRQAFAYAIDRGSIISGLLGGNADMGNDHVFAPVFPVSHYVNVPQRTRDLKKAKQLLTEAGYADGFDVDTTTYTGTGNDTLAQAVQEQVKAVGIRMHLKIEPLDTFYGHWTKLQMPVEGWAPRPSPTLFLDLGWTCGVPFNASHFCDKSFDSKIADYDAEVDLARRGAIAQDLAMTMHDQCASVIAYFERYLKVVGSHVHGQIKEAGDLARDLSRTWLD